MPIGMAAWIATNWPAGSCRSPACGPLGRRNRAGAARARRADWAAPHRLQRWARRRQSDNTVSAYAFEGINRLFSNADPLAVLARGPLLGLAGRLPPLQRALWRHAAGV